MSRAKLFVAAVAVLAFPLTVAAQSNEVGAFVTMPAFEETTMVDPELDLDLELSFDEKAGYGVSYNRFWTSQFSTEFAVQQMAADMEVSIVDGPTTITVEAGEVELTAFSGTAQWHFSRQSRVSPYVGAGLAYMTGEVEVPVDAEDAEVTETVDLENETTWLINGGVNFNLTPSLALGLDAKYIAYEPKGEGEIEDDSVALNPLVVSAALKFRF